MSQARVLSPIHYRQGDFLIGPQIGIGKAESISVAPNCREHELSVAPQLRCRKLESSAVLAHCLEDEFVIPLQARRGVFQGEARLLYGHLQQLPLVPKLGSQVLQGPPVLLNGSYCDVIVGTAGLRLRISKSLPSLLYSSQHDVVVFLHAGSCILHRQAFLLHCRQNEIFVAPEAV